MQDIAGGTGHLALLPHYMLTTKERNCTCQALLSYLALYVGMFHSCEEGVIQQKKVICSQRAF